MGRQAKHLYINLPVKHVKESKAFLSSWVLSFKSSLRMIRQLVWSLVTLLRSCCYPISIFKPSQRNNWWMQGRDQRSLSLCGLIHEKRSMSLSSRRWQQAVHRLRKSRIMGSCMAGAFRILMVICGKYSIWMKREAAFHKGASFLLFNSGMIMRKNRNSSREK